MGEDTPVAFYYVASWPNGGLAYYVAVSLSHPVWYMGFTEPRGGLSNFWTSEELHAQWHDTFEDHAEWLLPFLRDAIDSGVVDPAILDAAASHNEGEHPSPWVVNLRLADFDLTDHFQE